jgi:hypothetical protein
MEFGLLEAVCVITVLAIRAAEAFISRFEGN